MFVTFSYFLVLTIIVVVAAFVAISLWNCKDAGFNEKPSIVFSEKQEYIDGGQYTVYYSLGFKNVVYESEYGRNYYERLMPWDKIDTDAGYLTSNQYRQMTTQVKEYYNNQYDSINVLKKYFDTFGTFNASIFEVEKDENNLTIYMTGYLDSFIEYEKEVYGNPEILGEDDKDTDIIAYAPKYGDKRGIRMIVEATVDGDKLTVKEVKDFNNQELGEDSNINLYDIFPKAVARVMLTGDSFTEKLADDTKYRSYLDAVAHFGKPLTEDKYLEYNIDSDKGKITEITEKNKYELAF